MLQNKEHWKDVGYEVIQGTFKPGSETVILRPERNSPLRLKTSEDQPLVKVDSFDQLYDEVIHCAEEFRKFLDAGLEPHDLLAIAIDDRAARTYLSELALLLDNMGIQTNNIIADRFSAPPFLIEGKVTLSTVYRAKGNEAAVVAVLGCDAVPLRSRNGRNRLFTAFTRTKGWLRVTGMGSRFYQLKEEIETARRFAPELRFKMPDPQQIEMIQRDLAERDARLHQARDVIEDLGLTDEERFKLSRLLTVRQRNEK